VRPNLNCSPIYELKRVKKEEDLDFIHEKIQMTDSTMELQESGWEELRKEARKIEGDLDVKLSSYAKLGARFTQGGLSSSSSSSPSIILPLLFQ